MSLRDGIISTPWDQQALGCPTFEVLAPSEALLAGLDAYPGHYTLRIEPLASKELLSKYGFYYCDTLFEPYVDRQRFIPHYNDQVGIDLMPDIDEILKICHGAFRHGRFHRDFNVDPTFADRRYDLWTTQLFNEGGVFGLMYSGELAAFFGCRANKMVLHAVAERFQGRGLGKFLWSQACSELFARDCAELCSSVSASNLAIVNLYASLGFRFRTPVDVYHRVVR